MTARKKLIAGNWKMNGLREQGKEVEALIHGINEVSQDKLPDILVCPPATLLGQFAEKYAHDLIKFGGQDCHIEKSGAHTGDLAANMFADLGATAIIVGHSERRSDHGEIDRDISNKAQAVWASGMTAIICIGETEGERVAGRTLNVIERQLANAVPSSANEHDPDDLVIAYEPVWAIGTGLTPTAEDIKNVHNFIRKNLTTRFGEGFAQRIRLLYGGSVKPTNAEEILNIEDVDGALVGGASLKAGDFLGIIQACPSS